MHPNETFRLLYPVLWNEAYSKKYHDPAELLMSVGLYALCLGASTFNGLYGILHEAYGPKYANVVMDYSMFSIVSRLDVTQLYPERMKSEVVFSDRVYSDVSLGHLFKEDRGCCWSGGCCWNRSWLWFIYFPPRCSILVVRKVRTNTLPVDNNVSDLQFFEGHSFVPYG